MLFIGIKFKKKYFQVANFLTGIKRTWRVQYFSPRQFGKETSQCSRLKLGLLKIDLPYDPAIALLGIYPRDTGVLNSQIMERA